jgi:hypothetical protein
MSQSTTASVVSIRATVLTRPLTTHVVFGFAQSDSLRDEGSANAGLRDQRLAIEW